MTTKYLIMNESDKNNKMNAFFEISLLDKKGKSVWTFYFEKKYWLRQWRKWGVEDCKAYAEKLSCYGSVIGTWTTIIVKEQCAGNILCQFVEGNWHDTPFLETFLVNTK